MDTFISEPFMCEDCGASNPEKDVVTFIGGDYAIECDQCGGMHRFGNIYEDQVSAAHDAYNDMSRGK